MPLKFINKICIYSFLGLLLLLTSIYFLLLFGLPELLNSKQFIKKAESYIFKKTQIKITTENFNFKLSPKLNAVIYIDSILIDKNKNNIATGNKVFIDADLKSVSLNTINAETLFINIENLKKAFPRKKQMGKSSINLSKLPRININKITAMSDNAKLNINITDAKLRDFNCEKQLSFNGELTSPELNAPVIIGQQGNFIIHNNTISAKDFSITFKSGQINIDGKIYDKNSDPDFTVKGGNIPVSDLLKTLLYYQKLQDPKKKFLENFSNYRGTIKLAIKVKKDITGYIEANNLGAESVLFTVPIFFKKALFTLSDNELTSIAHGTLGTEEVVHTLKITNLTSQSREVTGTVYSTLTKRLVTKYLPEEIDIKQSAKAKVIYNIKNKKIDVKYFLNLPPGSDLFYKNAYLGLRNKERRFFAETYKDCNNLHLKAYNYSTIENGQIKNIIFGEGLFVNKNGHLTPQWITCLTNGYAPVSVTGSFSRYVLGGAFNGKLKYDFTKRIITGNFEVVKTIFNNFYVKSAKVIANEDSVIITANGKYLKQKFSCDLKAKNDFTDKITVYSMNLFLDKFNIIKHARHKGKTKHHLKNIDEISSKVRDIDMTIENWDIKVNTLTMDRIVLKDIELLGNLKDSIFQFAMPELAFANGLLSGKGSYNFNNNSSSIDFSARNIDSNIVADLLFNLKNQIQGIANATLHANTYNNLQSIKANGNFEIQDGFLPKLGSTEFIITKFNMNKKVRIANLTNVDLTRSEALNSDLKGSFKFNNYKLEDVGITSQQKAFSFLVEGDYDIKEQYADLNLYGKYDKEASKGVKIVSIPLNWILNFLFRNNEMKSAYQEKINKIPSIDNSKKEYEKYFKVNIQGNLNTDQIKVDIKGIE